MNEQRLQEIKERAEKATPGPWKVYQDAISTSIGTEFIHPQLNGPMPVITDAYHVGGAINIYIDDADAEFIAHARQDVPALIAEIERLRSVIWRISDRYDISINETKEFLAGEQNAI